MTIDPQELDAFVGAFVGDLAAVAHAATVVVGDKLGLYAALAAHGPATAADLAADTGCDERFLLEWLCAQAASGYCHHDPATGRFHLDEVQMACLADPRHPAFVVGGLTVASSMHKDEEAVARARSAPGTAWAGTSTTTTCSSARSASSAPATSPTS